MVDKIDIEVVVDTSELEAAEEKAQEVLAAAKETSEEVEKQSSISFNKVMLMARGAYMVTAGLIRATGGTVSTILRMTISAAISSIAVLMPILKAQLMTPATAIQGAIGLLNLGIAFAAIDAAMKKQTEMSRTMMGINTTLHGMSMMLGSYYL